MLEGRYPRCSPRATAGQTLSITCRQPLFAAALALYACQFFTWMLVLANADLSYAQPIMGLSYVSVSLMAALLFHETIPRPAWPAWPWSC